MMMFRGVPTALAIGIMSSVAAATCPPPDGPACVAAFTVAGSPLARIVAGLSTPPTCGCDAEAERFGAAGAHLAPPASFEEVVASVMTVAVTRTHGPTDMTAEDAAANFAANLRAGGSATILDKTSSVAIAGHEIETVPVSMAHNDIVLVCVFAGDRTTRLTLAQVCRASPKTDPASMLSKAGDIIADDLPGVAW